VRTLQRWVVLFWVVVPGAALAAAAAPARDAPDAVEERARAIEERVAALRESVFRTKARLTALEDMVVGGDLGAGARAVVLHRNEMGGAYVLESATFALDGAPVFARVDVDGDLDRQPQLDVFAGRVAPGPHQLAVKLVYRTRGGDRLEVRSSSAFDAARGQVTTVKVTGFEKGGLTTRLEERPALRFDREAKPEEPARSAPAGGAAR